MIYVWYFIFGSALVEYSSKAADFEIMPNS